MTHVLLVIVIVAAVVLLATMLSVWMKKAPQSGTATDVGQPGTTAAPAPVPPQQAERAAGTESPPPTPTSAPQPTEDPSSATLSFNAADLDFAPMPTAEDVATARRPGDPAPKGPQKLPASEVFTKLFDLALGKARPV